MNQRESVKEKIKIDEK